MFCAPRHRWRCKFWVLRHPEWNIASFASRIKKWHPHLRWRSHVFVILALGGVAIFTFYDPSAGKMQLLHCDSKLDFKTLSNNAWREFCSIASHWSNPREPPVAGPRPRTVEKENNESAAAIFITWSYHGPHKQSSSNSYGRYSMNPRHGSQYHQIAVDCGTNLIMTWDQMKPYHGSQKLRRGCNYHGIAVDTGANLIRTLVM